MNKRPFKISHSRVADGLDSLSGSPSVRPRLLPDPWNHAHSHIKTVNSVVPVNSGHDLREKLKRPKLQPFYNGPDVGNPVCKNGMKRISRWSQKKPVQEYVIRNNVSPNRKGHTQDDDYYSPNSNSPSNESDAADTDILSPQRPSLLPTPASNHPPTHYSQRSTGGILVNPPPANLSRILSPASPAPIPGLPIPKVKYLPGYSHSGKIVNESGSSLKVTLTNPTAHRSKPRDQAIIERFNPEGQSHHHSSERTENESVSSFKMKLKDSATAKPKVLENVNIKCFDPADKSHYPSEESSPAQQVSGVPPSGRYDLGVTGQYSSQHPCSSYSLLGLPAGHQQFPPGYYPHYPHLLSSQSPQAQCQPQNLPHIRNTPRPVKLNIESPTNYIDEIQKPVSIKLFEGIIGKTLDPALLIRCIKALAEIRETLPLPGHGMLSVTDKMTVFMALNDVLRRLHCNYEEQNQYENTTVVNCNKPLPVGTACRSKHDFVKAKAIEILSFLTNSEDISKLNDIDLTDNDEMEGVPEGLDWVYSLDENSLFVNPDTVASATQELSEPVEQQLDEIEGLIEPDIDLVFDDSQFS